MSKIVKLNVIRINKKIFKKVDFSKKSRQLLVKLEGFWAKPKIGHNSKSKGCQNFLETCHKWSQLGLNSQLIFSPTGRPVEICPFNFTDTVH